MQFIAKTAGRSLRSTRAVRQVRQRRLASSEQSYEPQTPAKGPASESFGSGFYIGLLAIPAAFAVYHISRPSKDGQDPYVTRLIRETYMKYAQENEDRNALHTQFIEQAAADRNLFLNSTNPGLRTVDVRFPEKINGGSAYNQAAGHSHANIDAVIAKYQKEAYEENERKLQQLRDNKVPAEHPFVSTMPKVTPAAADS